MDALYDKLFQAYKNGDLENAVKDIDVTEYSSLVSDAHKTTSSDSEYIPYPGYEDAQFYDKVLSKKEFIDIVGSKPSTIESYEKESQKRCSENSFNIAAHQTFVKRFLSPQTPYNGLLIYHGVGVGKTCSAISIAEQYIGLYKKKVLIISSGNIQDTFKKQIFDITKYNINTHTANLCTGTKYPDMIIDRTKISKDMFQKRIDRIINSRYQFMGYKELVNIMLRMKEKIEKAELNPEKRQKRYEESIKEVFSNRLIIIDEAHNLRMPSDTSKKQISSAFLELMSIIENVKLVLMTATPMFNDQREVIWMINLLLTNDKRPTLNVSDVFNKHGKITSNGKLLLEKACTGYISYMKGESPFSFPFRLFPTILNDKHRINSFPTIDYKGDDIPSSKQIQSLDLIGSRISKEQKKVYEKMLDVLDEDNTISEENEENDEQGDTNTTNDFQNMMQLCNIVYPSDNIKRTYGREGFFDYFSKIQGMKGTRFEYKDQTKQILSYDNIGLYSPKIKRILDYIINSKGVVFIYSQYYHSGILPIAIALEHIGFNKLKGNITDKIAVEQKMPLLSNGKRPNYVILSRDRDLSSNNNDEINIARSLDNINGDLIKVVIVSKIGSEGIDFKFIREIHLLDPWYNLNRSEQIIGRGVRTCSHIALPKEKRNTSIYMHALTLSNKSQESMDLHVYRIAENKQKSIDKVEDILKSVSIDCEFNKPNIMMPNNVDLSFDIETSQGKLLHGFNLNIINKDITYTCKGKRRDDVIDKTTYTYDLISDEIETYKSYIVQMYKGNIKHSYKELVQLLKNEYNLVDEDILQYTLQTMLDEEYQFIGYRGQKGHLLYANDKYVFNVNALSSDIEHKARLPLHALSNRNKYKTQPNDVLTSNDKTNSQNMSNTNSAENHVDGYIVEYIQSQTNLLLKHVPNKYKEYIYDAIIDRMSSEQLVSMMLLLRSNDLPELFVKSLKRANFIIYDTNDRVIGFYNHIEGVFYCYKNNTFSKCTAIDLVKMNESIERLRSVLITKPATKGFIQHKKDHADFKVRDGNTSGYVCRNTHSLLVEDLKRRILDVDPEGISDKTLKLSKAKMCDIYEAILRKKGDFTRPFLLSSAK